MSEEHEDRDHRPEVPESITRAADAFAAAANAVGKQLTNGPFTSFTVRLTPEKQRELLGAALASAEKHLAQAQDDLASLQENPPPARDIPGAPQGYYASVSPSVYAEANVSAAASRVGLLRFALDHLADGDVVSDAAYVHQFLTSPSIHTIPAGGILASQRAVPRSL